MGSKPAARRCGGSVSSHAGRALPSQDHKRKEQEEVYRLRNQIPHLSPNGTLLI